MRIAVRFFAVQAERLGAEPKTLELPAGATVGAAVAALRAQYKDVPWAERAMVAVNQAYAGEDERLREGDELAIIPPVSGG